MDRPAGFGPLQGTCSRTTRGPGGDGEHTSAQVGTLAGGVRGLALGCPGGTHEGGTQHPEGVAASMGSFSRRAGN